MRPTHRAVAALLSLLALRVLAASVPVGQGSVLDHLPPGQLGPTYDPISTNQVPTSAFPRVAAGTKGPYPTNDWWSSLLFQRFKGQDFGNALFAWPLAFQAQANGWAVGAPDPTASLGTEFHYGQVSALVAKVDGLSASKVQPVDWTDWTVRARLEDGTHRLDATMGHGLPFVHFASQGGDAIVSCLTNPVIFAGAGTDAVGIIVAGNSYGLFAPPGSSWSLSGNAFRSGLSGKGHWSIAVLPSADAATLARFRRSAFAYPTGTRVTWTVDPASAKVRTTYAVHSTALEGTDTTTLMALFRHQWAFSKDVNTSWSYVSPRGAMRVVDGTSFTTEDALPAILPSLPPPAPADTAALRKELLQAASGKILDPSADTYWAGKGFWRCASLIDIADQLGAVRLRDSLVGALKSELESWFTASSNANPKTTKVFAIDSAWGSLIGYPASYGSDGELNDHHFHYGYFIKAAATVARFDPAWARNYAGMVRILIRDANGVDRNDPTFPFLRHFDIYEGHSWASGHANASAGNNQESSSEAMNYDAAVALWGMATGNDTLRDAGLWMAATEMRTVEQYWWDVDGQVFPKGFSHLAVGMVWGNGGAHSTWWDPAPEYVHGINVLPFTPSSLQWTRRPERVRQEYAEMLAEKSGGALTNWPEVMMAYRGIGDPQGAWNAFVAWDGSNAEGGTPRAWYRQWLALLRDRGTLDTTVTADHPAAMVLVSNAIRSYIAWNPGTQETVVHFTDGRSLTVPAGKVALSSGTPTGIASQRKHLQSDARRIVGAQQLRQMGETSVTAVGLDGGVRFQGKASDAARTIGNRLWILTGQQP